MKNLPIVRTLIVLSCVLSLLSSAGAQDPKKYSFQIQNKDTRSPNVEVVLEKAIASYVLPTGEIEKDKDVTNNFYCEKGICELAFPHTIIQIQLVFRQPDGTTEAHDRCYSELLKPSLAVNVDRKGPTVKTSFAPSNTQCQPIAELCPALCSTSLCMQASPCVVSPVLCPPANCYPCVCYPTTPQYYGYKLPPPTSSKIEPMRPVYVRYNR